MRRILLTFLLCSCQALAPGGSGPEPEPEPEPEPDPDPTPDPEDFAYLSPTDHLVRISMVLRGIRPSIDELELVRADATAIESLVEMYVDSPEFGETMRDLHSEAYLTRGFTLQAVDELATTPTGQIGNAIGDEPLRLIEYVVMNDLPYTEIVTANYTVANQIVATAYGMTYDPAGPEWQVTHYNDGRPEAGVLSSTTFFLRHRSAGANWHRGRANQISKALLCYDFLDRDVVIEGSVDLSDPAVVRDAVRNNEACASCHQTLDPLASFLWPWDPNINVGQITNYPLVGYYDPATANRWMNTSQRPPGFFGLDGDNLDDLGDLIAADPRFAMCAAQRFYAYFTETDLGAVPLEEAAALQELFIDSGYSAKALAKAVVLSDVFRRSHGQTEAAQEVAHGYLKVRPEQMDRMIADLTGFTWETAINFNFRGGPLGRVNLSATSVLGFVALAGGIDGVFVVQPTFGYNVTAALVLRTAAQEAAGFVVETDFAQTDQAQRRLLTRGDAGDVGEAQVKAQIADLHARFWADFSGPDSALVAETYGLWQSTYDRTGDAAHAWKTTITAMLQDLRTAFY